MCQSVCVSLSRCLKETDEVGKLQIVLIYLDLGMNKDCYVVSTIEFYSLTAPLPEG